MIENLNRLFEDFCFKSFKDSLNHCANMALYKANTIGENLEVTVSKALGRPVRLGNYRKSDASEIMLDVQSSLEFRGDQGSHPDLGFLDSQDFLIIKHQILERPCCPNQRPCLVFTSKKDILFTPFLGFCLPDRTPHRLVCADRFEFIRTRTPQP